jgi:hypothetical protein
VRVLPFVVAVALALAGIACSSSSNANAPSTSVQLTPQSETVLNVGGATATYSMTVNGQPYTGAVDCSQTQGGTAGMVNGQIVFTPGPTPGLFPVICIPSGMSNKGTASVQVAKMTHIVYAPVGVSFSQMLRVFLVLGLLSPGGTTETPSPCGAVQVGSGDSWACDVSLVPNTPYYLIAVDPNRLTPPMGIDFADGLTADGVALGQTPDRVINMGTGVGYAVRLDINTSYVPH